MEWGRHCAEIAVEHVKARTGRDLWEELGPCPRSWREAAEFYRRNGGARLADIVTKALGDPVDPKLARRGDICMVDGALGICRGEWVECDRMQPLHRASMAWRIE